MSERAPLSIAQAHSELAGLRHMAEQGGSVDSERDAFTNLERSLLAGEGSPEDIIRSARALVAGRQDYH